MKNIRLDDIQTIINMGDRFLEIMEEQSRLPDDVKQPKLYKMGDVEAMLGKSRKTIIAAEERGIISETLKTAGGHRYLTLKQINDLRAHFQIQKWRKPTDEPLVIASAVTKGGVGKSVNTVTFAHALAERGYRVLILDLDPQATTTSAHGYIPDHPDIGLGKGIETEKTIVPFMELDEKTLKSAIRDTSWDGLKLIASNLETYGLEYTLAGHMVRAGSELERKRIFHRLKKGIDTVKYDFDVVLLDAPPSFGFIPLSILVAADALLIPSPARMYDFLSTVQFFRMVREVMSEIDPGKEYKWAKVLITQYAPAKAGQQKFVSAMRKCFGDFPMNNIFYEAADIQNASNDFQSIFEYKKARKKTIDMISPIVDELEGLIRSTWEPSQDASAAVAYA